MSGPAVARAVDTVLRQQGYIRDDGSTLAEMAHETWSWWWSTQWKPPEADCAHELVNAAQTRPWVNPWIADDGEAVSQRAWMRPADYVVDPSHSKLWTTGSHIPRWTAEYVTTLMAGVQWALTERPGGWASHPLGDGNNRSCDVTAAGLPLIRVELRYVARISGRPFALRNPSGRSAPGFPFPRGGRPQPASRHPCGGAVWSDSTLEQIERLHAEGLCAKPDWSQIRPSWSHRGPLRVSDERPTLVLPWVDPLFPWIVAEQGEEVDARRRAAHARWGRP